jgi:hypothetical protein
VIVHVVGKFEETSTLRHVPAASAFEETRRENINTNESAGQEKINE